MNAKDIRSYEQYVQDFQKSKQRIATAYNTLLRDESRPKFEKRAAYQIIANTLGIVPPVEDYVFLSRYVDDEGEICFNVYSIPGYIVTAHHLSNGVLGNRRNERKTPIDLLHDLQEEMDCGYNVADNQLTEVFGYINEIIEKLETV